MSTAAAGEPLSDATYVPAGKSGDARRRERRDTVNVHSPVSHVLRDLAARHDRTLTDELTRAVALWRYVDEQLAQGGAILVRSGRDSKVRELLFDLL